MGEGKPRSLKLPALRIYQVIWGYTEVGKSTLLARSMNKKLDNIGTTEYGELQYGLLDSRGDVWRCIWDLGGQDSMTDEIKSSRGLQQLKPFLDKGSVGFIYVFDGYEHKGEYCSSLEPMLDRHGVCKELFGPAYDACPKVVVKNKCDLPPGRLLQKEWEQITQEIKPLHIYELSAYKSPVEHVREPFRALDKALVPR
jgi:GTPase SAR1 family protein